MTWEEIIQEYEGAVVANGLAAAAVEEAMRSYELFKAGLDALRPTREQVEKVWRGEWVHKRSPYDYKIFVCKKCGKQISIQGEPLIFCPACGAAQTDEAVQMVMEKLKKVIE